MNPKITGAVPESFIEIRERQAQKIEKALKATFIEVLKGLKKEVRKPKKKQK